MHGSQKYVCVALYVAIAWGVGARGTASGQQVELTLPKDDPNQNSDSISSVAFSPDGKIVATGHGVGLGMLQEARPGQTILWEAHSGKRLKTLPALKDGVLSVAFSPDGKILAVTEYPGIIRLIAVPEGREVRKIETKQEGAGFMSAAFSPDGKLLAAGVATKLFGGGNDVQIRNVDDGKIVRSLVGHGGPVVSVAFSPDGKLLASGAWDGTARIWEVASGKSLKTLTFPALAKKIEDKFGKEDGAKGVIAPWVQSVTFSPDGRSIAAAAGVLQFFGAVDVWEVTTGKAKATLKGITPTVRKVVYSPDSKFLATADGEGSVKLWDGATFQEFVGVDGYAPIAFSPDGKAIALTGGSRTVFILKIPDAKRP